METMNLKFLPGLGWVSSLWSSSWTHLGHEDDNCGLSGSADPRRSTAGALIHLCLDQPHYPLSHLRSQVLSLQLQPNH